jgi:protein involved in polysaccharide export with SLBB domain
MRYESRPALWRGARGALTIACLCLVGGSGCWAPLSSRAISASCLPQDYRTPRRTAGAPLNFANLTLPAGGDYVLGPDDVLEVTIHGLYPGAEVRPVRVRIMANGEIYLPMVGAVQVGGMNLVKANEAITQAYADGFIKDPRTNVTLAEKATTAVVVLGEVRNPGVQRLPKYENDVAHALAAAGGLAEDAADEIEVHRRSADGALPCVPIGFQVMADDAAGSVRTADAVQPIASLEPPTDDAAVVWANEDSAKEQEQEVLLPAHSPATAADSAWSSSTADAAAGVPEMPAIQWAQQQTLVPDPSRGIARIPMRGVTPGSLRNEDVILRDGDVIVVPSRKSEVFFVVGKLSPTNFVRFNIGARERDLGAGFLLPRDREIDVVTAVAMAGYIDPIDSPTTVTVHRICPNGEPMLVNVDLIKARYCREENLLVEPGDIIYLNPDFPWWFRRTFDRVVDNVGFSFTHRLGSTR